MSQTTKRPNFHTLKISNTSKYGRSTGATTMIELDGKPLKGVTFLKLELKANGLVRATVDMLLDIDSIELEDVELIKRIKD